MHVLRQEWQRDHKMAKSNDQTQQNDQDKQGENNNKMNNSPGISDGYVTVTVYKNYELDYNGIIYKGGNTLSVDKETADFLISNNYVCAGSILPRGGVFIPSTVKPIDGSSTGP